MVTPFTIWQDIFKVDVEYVHFNSLFTARPLLKKLITVVLESVLIAQFRTSCRV
jgi:hypothetical protein